MSRGEKKDYVQLGTRIPPGDYSDLKTFYQGYGMISKVIRVLINRHIRKLREKEAQAGLALAERITDQELAEAE